MDKRAAAQYISKLFGTGQGFVAVAHKDKNESWEERTFAYPSEKAKVVSWAAEHADGNVFICPALRATPTREKGDGVNLRWLWADVDWDKVPENKREEVRKAILSLGAMEVASGTGRNMHVYVPLDREVDRDEHYRLNSGLRALLYADAKHADNSLLRLPGTTNWKTEAGSPVKMVKASEGQWQPGRLQADHKAFRDVRVTDTASGGSEWLSVDVSDLPRRIHRLVTMDVAQAEVKYKKRHRAVWGVTRELFKRGLSDDQIHTLMDNFPPAIDKNEEEHNGYDVHRDVGRCLAAQHIAEDAALTEDEAEAIQEEAMDAADDATDDDAFAKDVKAAADRELVRRAGSKLARQMEAERAWREPPMDASWTLTRVLVDPPPPAQHLIGIPPGGKRGMAGVKHNVIITAQFKTGKTKFVIASIAQSLCDGTDFLGHVPVHTPEGGVVVGHWNCEMDPAEMAADYVIPAGIENTHNLRGVDLRGHRVSLLSELDKAWAIRWLKGEIPDQDGNYPPPVKVWTIDSLARLARMAGVSEKDNDEMFDLLMAIDEIKVQADVDVVFLITHTGRTQMEEGKERARGATAIDDWCDARWIMTEDSGIRFLTVDGRGVGMDKASMDYDEATGRSTWAGLNGAQTVAHGWEQVAMELVNGMGEGRPITESVLVTRMQERAKAVGKKLGVNTAKQHIIEAAENGYIVRKKEPGARGPLVWNHYMVTKPENDRTRKATPRDVNMALAKPRRDRK
jgi:hypothetical protein